MASEWREVALGTLAEIYDGPHATPPKTSEGPLFLGISTLVNGRLELAAADHLSEEDYRRWTRRIVPAPGDVVFSYETRLGEAALIPHGLRCCLGRRLGLLRARPDGVDPRFLLYAYLGPQFQETLRARTIHGSTVDRIPLIDLADFPIFVPDDIGEQRAIASVLGALDDKIELNRRMSETLEAMALALFKSWFVDFDPVRAKCEGRDSGLPQHLAGLFPDRLVPSALGETPAGWMREPVGNHMTNFDALRIPVSGADRAKRQGPYPYHGAAGVLDHVDAYLFDGVYLLVGEDGSVVRDGVAVTQYLWDRLWVNNHAHVLQGRDSVSTEQLYLYFGYEPISPYVTGAVQPKLSQGRMNTMPFLFAGPGVCRMFGKLIQPLFATVRANADTTATLVAIRDALLPKLISGELRAPDAERIAVEAGA